MAPTQTAKRVGQIDVCGKHCGGIVTGQRRVGQNSKVVVGQALTTIVGWQATTGLVIGKGWTGAAGWTLAAASAVIAPVKNLALALAELVPVPGNTSASFFPIGKSLPWGTAPEARVQCE